MRVVVLIIAAMTLLFPTVGLAHGGGLNAQGCHNDRKNGGYHCHRGGGESGGSSQRIRQAYTPPKPRPNKATVRQVQSLLADLNYKPGPADGAPGRATKQAITEFNSQYVGHVDVEDYDSVLIALQKTKQEKEEAAQRQITESASTTEKEGGAGGWLLGLFAVIGAYWFGMRNKGKP